MIYLKKQLKDGTKLDIPVYDDEFYCRCPNCGREFQLTPELLEEIICDDDCDFASTTISCGDCEK